jgi:N-6 DNA Methylase
VYLTEDRDKLSTQDWTTLQTRTFYAKEKKSLAYVIGIMNMILHGIEAANIVHTNTLTENISDIQEKDRFEVIMANPRYLCRVSAISLRVTYPTTEIVSRSTTEIASRRHFFLDISSLFRLR